VTWVPLELVRKCQKRPNKRAKETYYRRNETLGVDAVVEISQAQSLEDRCVVQHLQVEIT
jgi:hypothetical protein